MNDHIAQLDVTCVRSIRFSRRGPERQVNTEKLERKRTLRHVDPPDDVFVQTQEEDKTQLIKIIPVVLWFAVQVSQSHKSGVKQITSLQRERYYREYDDSNVGDTRPANEAQEHCAHAKSQYRDDEHVKLFGCEDHQNAKEEGEDEQNEQTLGMESLHT